jgi:hypothetical protein
MAQQGKTSPFNPDGKSGATGNNSGATAPGMSKHRGPDRPQRMGNNDFNPDSVPDGGRVLKIEPPGDRSGMIGQTATRGIIPRGPFKIGMGNGGKKSSLAGGEGGQKGTETKNADINKGGPVGDIPTSDKFE